MGRRDGNALLVVAALILGASIVAAAVLIQSSLDKVAGEVASIRTTMAAMPAAAAAAPARATPPAKPQRAQRPDPAKRYKIDTAGSPSKGGSAETAKVVVVEYSDFQCPFCSRVTPTLNQIEEAYGDKVQIVFKHLPLRMHSNAPGAHAAAEAAHRQGKFWEMHDKIFANQRELNDAKYIEYAGELELDVEKFKRDLADPSVKAKVDADAREASSLGVTGTPGFFINGRFLSGARPFDSFKVIIDEELPAG